MTRFTWSRRSRVFGSMAVLVCVVSGVWLSRSSAVSARTLDTVTLAEGSRIALVTPPFIQVGKRYAFTWPGGGPPQTYLVKELRRDGWILVDVAEENLDPAFLVPGQTPTRWLHVALAVSVQEMRPLPY
jgi:hypothetical protein